MQVKDEVRRLSRRDFLASGSAAALLTITATAVICPTESWGLAVKALKPETMRSLIHMARDIYPHDRLGDRIYALALKGLDTTAAKDATIRDMLELGVKNLNGASELAHKSSFTELGWEDERLKLLRQIETSPFFQKVRSTLVTGIYNNREVWMRLGYEGPSAGKGGYIKRGFDDVDWL